MYLPQGPFDFWNIIKKRLQFLPKEPYFEEGEIWYLSLDDKSRVALEHIRTISSRRLLRKVSKVAIQKQIEVLDKVTEILEKTKLRLSGENLGSSSPAG